MGLGRGGIRIILKESIFVYSGECCGDIRKSRGGFRVFVVI